MRIERFWPLVAGSALVLAGIAAATGSLSTHQGLALTILGPLAGLAFVGAGLLGWFLRPDNGTGRLLVVIGFVFLIFTTLWAANDSVLYTTGNAFGSMYLAIFAQLLLSYPAGRLSTRIERVAVISLYCVATAAALLPTFFRGGVDTSCPSCPSNAFLVYNSRHTADILNGIFSVAGIVVFASLFAVLAVRWRRATPATRRVLAPVYACGGAAVGLLGLGFAVDFASSTAGGVFWALALTCFIALPFFFVGGLLRWRLSRAGMRLLDAGLGSPFETEKSLREALGDPTLRLGYWLEDERAYVDPDGEVLELRDAEDRLTRTISHEGRPLAAVEYDSSLSHEPELLEEVLAAARLTLEREQALQATRIGEARSRALLGVLPDAMIRTNRAGEYLEVQGSRAALVRPAEDLIGLTIRDTLPPHLVEQVLACIERTLSTGELQTLEYELELDGLVRNFEARMIPSSPDEVVSIVRDFTAERQLREELTARLEQLEREQSFTATVVNTAPVIFLLIDEAGRIVRFNNTCEQLTGWDDDEAIRGRPFWEVFLASTDHYWAQDMLADLAYGTPLVEQTLHWQSRGGEELVIAMSSTSILNAEGVRLILVCGLDVTERERHLDELRASRSRIVEAGDAERRRLERNLHDGAQQRLVSISLALRLAQGRVATDPQSAVEILDGAGGELAAALEELRELARGLHPAVLADRGLEAAVDSLAERAAVPVDVQVELEQRLPTTVEVGAFYVIAESLTNVAKYARAERALVRVTREDGLAVVEVRDDGAGGAEIGAGTGLRGLSDRLAALDGRLEIDSAPGAGTVVRATIPVPSHEEPMSPVDIASVD